MDEFWIRLLTALVLLHQTTSTTNTEELFGTVGGSVTLRIQDTSGGDVAAWNFEDRHIVTASFEDPPQALFTTQAFKKRFAVSEKGRALSISRLRLEDAGTYSVKINKKTSIFILHVYRELAEPTVTCEAQNCSSDGSCHFTLRCSVSGTDFGNVSYTWRAGDQSWGDGPVVVLVNKSSLEQPKPPTCTARNPVSSRNVTVRTPDLLCTG
ncbi:LY9 protein, partial [Catharus fuscescens]|nr:LY9 protein [Catharus fuscescens]